MDEIYCLGHLLKKEGEEDILAGRVFVYVMKDFHARFGSTLQMKYKLLVRFTETRTFKEIEHLLTRDYMRNRDTDWVMDLLKDQILPEINRLKSKGFIINSQGVSEFMSEMV